MNHLNDEQINEIVDSDGKLSTFYGHIEECETCKGAVDNMYQLHRNLFSVAGLIAPDWINDTIMAKIKFMQDTVMRANKRFMGFIIAIFSVLILSCVGVTIYYTSGALNFSLSQGSRYLGGFNTWGQKLEDSVTHVIGSANNQMVILAGLIFIGSVLYIGIEQYRDLKSKY